jgi:hypothetical protein
MAHFNACNRQNVAQFGRPDLPPTSLRIRRNENRVGELNRKQERKQNRDGKGNRPSQSGPGGCCSLVCGCDYVLWLELLFV